MKPWTDSKLWKYHSAQEVETIQNIIPRNSSSLCPKEQRKCISLSKQPSLPVWSSSVSVDIPLDSLCFLYKEQLQNYSAQMKNSVQVTTHCQLHCSLGHLNKQVRLCRTAWSSILKDFLRPALRNYLKLSLGWSAVLRGKLTFHKFLWSVPEVCHCMPIKITVILV